MRELFWPLLAVLSWLAVYWLVEPRIFIRLGKLMGAGFLLAFFIQLCGVTWLALWDFAYPVLSIGGVTVFLPLAYGAEVLLFGYFLPPDRPSRVWYVLTFSGINVLVAGIARALGYLVFIRWDLVATLLLGIVAHVVLLYLYDYLVPEFVPRS
ncbi:MAG: hypothetical protein H5U03_07655 [Clostridia bacterium]|nr:hypothetical protein [Clostridia bacterium]